MTLSPNIPISLTTPEVFAMKTQFSPRRPLQLRQIQLEDGTTVTVRIRGPIQPTVDDFAPIEASSDTPLDILPSIPTDTFDPSI